MIIRYDIRENVTEAIERKMAALGPERVAQEISEPLRLFWSRHLLGQGTNKKGWPSTGFFEQAADQTTATATGSGVLLTCNKTGLHHLWTGGRISPVKAGALTIPISPVSYGHHASEFSGLFLFRAKSGKAFLVQRGETLTSTGQFKQTKEIGRGRKKNEARRLKAGLNFLFVLVSGVNITPHPKIVPSNEEFAEVAMAAIERSLLK